MSYTHEETCPRCGEIIPIEVNDIEEIEDFAECECGNIIQIDTLSIMEDVIAYASDFNPNEER